MKLTCQIDVDWVRSCFPALTSNDALFDNAGGSVPPRSVIEELTSYLSECAVQLGATYGASSRSGARVAEGRAAVAALVGARPEELVFAASTTRNVATLARGFAPSLRPGDEVVVTNLDHEANGGPWRRLVADGATLREWKLRPETARLHVEDLAPLLGERTRLVAVPHASNLTGTVLDLAAVEALVRPTGALLVVDEVAFAPHSMRWGPAGHGDIAFVSLYKTLGPHLAVAWARKETLVGLANQNHFFYAAGDVPQKFEPGGVAHEAVASMRGVLAYWMSFDEHHDPGQGGTPLERVRRATTRAESHERALAARLLDYVASRDDLDLVGPASSAAADRVPIVSFLPRGRSSRALVSELDRAKLGVRHGHFYARRAAEALGLEPDDGVVRVSFAHYNAPQELDRLMTALDRALDA